MVQSPESIQVMQTFGYVCYRLRFGSVNIQLMLSPDVTPDPSCNLLLGCNAMNRRYHGIHVFRWPIITYVRFMHVVQYSIINCVELRPFCNTWVQRVKWSALCVRHAWWLTWCQMLISAIVHWLHFQWTKRILLYSIENFFCKHPSCAWCMCYRLESYAAIT